MSNPETIDESTPAESAPLPEVPLDFPLSAPERVFTVTVTSPNYPGQADEPIPFGLNGRIAYIQIGKPSDVPESFIPVIQAAQGFTIVSQVEKSAAAAATV